MIALGATTMLALGATSKRTEEKKNYYALRKTEEKHGDGQLDMEPHVVCVPAHDRPPPGETGSARTLGRRAEVVQLGGREQRRHSGTEVWSATWRFLKKLGRLVKSLLELRAKTPRPRPRLPSIGGKLAAFG